MTTDSNEEVRQAEEEAARQAEEGAARRQAEAARKQAEEAARRRQAEEEKKAKANEQVIQATIAVERLQERGKNFDEDSARAILAEFDVLESKHNAIRSLKSDTETRTAYEKAYTLTRHKLLKSVIKEYEKKEQAWTKPLNENKLASVDNIHAAWMSAKENLAWLVATVGHAKEDGLDSKFEQYDDDKLEIYNNDGRRSFEDELSRYAMNVDMFENMKRDATNYNVAQKPTYQQGYGTFENPEAVVKNITEKTPTEDAWSAAAVLVRSVSEWRKNLTASFPSLDNYVKNPDSYGDAFKAFCRDDEEVTRAASKFAAASNEAGQLVNDLWNGVIRWQSQEDGLTWLNWWLGLEGVKEALGTFEIVV